MLEGKTEAMQMLDVSDISKKVEGKEEEKLVVEENKEVVKEETRETKEIVDED